MRRWFLSCLVLLSLFACEPEVYKGTQIPNTPENQEIIDVVAKYQKAMEARDFELLLDMATPDYYEDRGTLDKSDDYGLVELKANLEQRFSTIQQMRYTVKIKDIKIKGDEAFVDFHYQILFQFKLGDSARWERAEDDGQLAMKRVDKTWKIYSGL
jgi:ketosteroid isomerase-like protein